MGEADDVNAEEFVSARIKRKLKGNKSSLVQDEEIFISGILGSKIRVSGSEVKSFIKDYSDKLAQYLNKPFLTILVDGELFRNIKNFRKYILGISICKHYGFPTKRFIEVQFYYHDKWKGCAPSLSYVTSLVSEWNSVGRYKKYCETYKNEIDYFDEGHDNVDAAYQSRHVSLDEGAPQESLVRIYEEMICFQMGATGKSKKDVLWMLGEPGKSHLPLRYLKNLPLYRELISEDAWGEGPYKFDFYHKLKQEIENC